MATATVSVPERAIADAGLLSRTETKAWPRGRSASPILSGQGWIVADKPELGAEAANEGEALSKHFKQRAVCSTPSWSTRQRGDPGWLSTLVKAARAQIAGPQVNGFKEDTNLNTDLVILL